MSPTPSVTPSIPAPTPLPTIPLEPAPTVSVSVSPTPPEASITPTPTPSTSVPCKLINPPAGNPTYTLDDDHKIWETPIAHFRSETLTGNPGDEISQWVDSSGNNNHISQGTPSARPVIGEFSEMDLPSNFNRGAVFSGGQFLNRSLVLSTIMNDWGMEMYVVARTNSSSGIQGIMSLQSDNRVGDNYLTIRAYDKNINSARHNNSAGKKRNLHEFDAHGCWHPAGNKNVLFPNLTSNENVTGVETTTTSTDYFPFDTIRVGQYQAKDNNGGGQEYLDGAVLEVIVFKDSIHCEERQRIRDYLVNKYDLENKRLVGDKCIQTPGQLGQVAEIREVDSYSENSLSKDIGWNDRPRRPWTLDFWVRPVYNNRTHSTEQCILHVTGKRDTSPDGIKFTWSANNNTLHVRDQHYHWAGYDYMLDRWTRLTLVHDVGEDLDVARLYINGKRTSYTGHASPWLHTTNSPQSTSKIVLGGYYKDYSVADSFYAGKYAGLRITHTAYNDGDFDTLPAKINEYPEELDNVVEDIPSTSFWPLVSSLYTPQDKPLLFGTKLQDIKYGRHNINFSRHWSLAKMDFLTAGVGDMYYYNHMYMFSNKICDVAPLKDILYKPNVNTNYHIELQDNRIETLTPLKNSNFTVNANVYKLNVSLNELTHVDGLQGLKYASIIDFSYNKISDISAFSEYPADCCNTLKLNNNQITTIPAGLFNTFKPHTMEFNSNPITDWTGLPSNDNLTSFKFNKDMGAQVSLLDQLPNLNTITLQHQSSQTAPSLTNTDLHNVTYTTSDMTDMTPFADIVNLPVWKGRTSTTAALYDTFDVSSCKIHDWYNHQAWRWQNKSIEVYYRLIVNNNEDFEDMKIFEDSWQHPDYTNYSPYTYAQFNNTNVSNTQASLGAAKNWVKCKGLYLSHSKNFTTLDSLFRDDHLAYSRQDYIDSGTFSDAYFNYTNIDDISWMSKANAAGIYHLNLTYCVNLDYQAFKDIVPTLIALKNANQIRLTYIYASYTAFDDKIADGTYPKCENGAYSEYTQIKADLLGAGIYMQLARCGLSGWSSLPTC